MGIRHGRLGRLGSTEPEVHETLRHGLAHGLKSHERAAAIDEDGDDTQGHGDPRGYKLGENKAENKASEALHHHVH